MKKIVLFIILFSFFAVSGCSNEDDESQNNIMKAREVAWNSLSAEQQATVITNWQEANVEIKEDGTYHVRFNTTDDPLLGPIVVFVNSQTFEIEGYAPRF
jgi:uncharacterized protein YcfL